MSWITSLDELENLPKTSDWRTSRELLEKYETLFRSLRTQYSVFELVMNLKFEDGNFFNAYEHCISRDGVVRFRECWGYPLSLVIYVFRCFFEKGTGNDYYKAASKKYKTARGDDRNCKEVNFREALLKVWGNVFIGDDIRAYNQQTGIPRELFCSRCWLIKNFQKKEGNSNLCHAIRAYKGINDKVLRLRPECYPKKNNGSDGCEEHLRRLLTAPGCELEREYLADFVDNGATDDVRFAWYEQLDNASKAIVRNLVEVVVDKNGVLCFVVNKEYDFSRANSSANAIKIKLFLRSNELKVKEESQVYWFEKNNKGWRCKGVTGSTDPQPIWKITSIVKIEFDSQFPEKVYSHEDILGEMLSGCNLPAGHGVFLVNESKDRCKRIYLPFSNRKLPVGTYSVYAYRYVDNADLKVIYDKTNVSVNDVPLGKSGRSYEVKNENDDVTVCVYGEVFSFGVNKCSPIRDSYNRERNIEHSDSKQVFLSVKKWPLSSVDKDSWSYEINGQTVKSIEKAHLYKTGVLKFSCNGVNYEESKVTFVDFVVEEVFAKFPELSVEQSATVELVDSGELNGRYEIGAKETTYHKELPGGQGWRLNIPIIREGVTFRSENGTVVLSCHFKEHLNGACKVLAIEDFKNSLCTSYCAPGYDHIAITSLKYCNGEEYNTHIPLLKGRGGFVFSKSSVYLANRSGVNGDVRMRDLMSDKQVVESFVLEEFPVDKSKPSRKCRIRLYDPKLLPVDGRSVVNGRVSISFYVSYYSYTAEKVMRWLPSDELDKVNGVRTFKTWTSQRYSQEDDGRWKLELSATTMHGDIGGVFNRGAVILAFIADNRRLISGGFCLFDQHNNSLRIVGGDWESRLTMAMHKRYGVNSEDLNVMLGIYTLRLYETENNLRRDLYSRLNALRSNVKTLGRGADLYMNSLFNAREDQWSGYAFLAGWYFAECAANEIISGELDTPEECMCFFSSTGRRIWHPIMITRRAIIQSGKRAIWKAYYENLISKRDCKKGFQELCDRLSECLEKNEWYKQGLMSALEKCEIGLDTEDKIGEALNLLVDKIDQWRVLAEFRNALDEEQSKLDAEELLVMTQKLRNAVLSLEEVDDQMRSTGSEYAEGILFLDLVKIIDAQKWLSNRLNNR